MDADWQTPFFKSYNIMISDLNINETLYLCLSKQLLTMDEKSEVDYQGTPYQKNDKLLTLLYKKFCGDPLLYKTFVSALEDCPSSNHLVKSLSETKDCENLHKLSTNKMRNIYRRTFHYVLQKAKSLNSDCLMFALISAGVLDMDGKESIKHEFEHRAKKLIHRVYEQGFEAYLKFTSILSEFSSRFELYLGQVLSDHELWSLSSSIEKCVIPSCPCKEGSGVDTIKCPKPCLSHMTSLDYEASSDSGLEPESPIARRKVFNRPHSALCTGKKAHPLTATLKAASAQSSVYIEYIQHVRSCYVNPKYFETNEWPSMQTQEYINLALIKKQKVSRGKTDDFTKATLHGSIDQIARKKEPIALKDLFKDPEDRVILVHGGPGIGKSTFALELCKKWKVSELLKQFKLVQLVQLCNPCHANATDVRSLLFTDSTTSNYIDRVASEIVASSGEGVLFILDGYDELSTKRQVDPFFIDLIKGLHIPNCKVLITSRPSVTEKLEMRCGSFISKSVEILGFLYKDIVSYTKDVFADDSEEGERFLSYINSNQMIRSIMYIPLNTAIVCELYKSSCDENKSVPMTMTKLYSDLTFCIICRFMNRKHITYDETDYEGNIIQIVNSLPVDLQKYFSDLCSFAFQKLCSGADSFMFDSIPSDIEHMGFIRKASTIKCLPFGKAKSQYTSIFLHLTIQEFLSAVHIATQSKDEQLASLRKLADLQDDICTVVLRFVAGLTDGFSALSLIDVLQFLGVSHSTTGMSSCNSVALNCLYEAQNPNLCLQVFKGANVNFSPMTITTFDYYALGYCIANTKCLWKLCCIGAEGVEMIALALNTAPVIHGRIALIKLSYEGNKILLLDKLPPQILHEITELNLSNCELDQKSCDNLASIVPSLHNLRKLDIGDNPFKEGEATKLLSALSQLKGLAFLDLLHARLNSCDLQMLKGIIKPHSSLNCLIIGDSSMSTDIVEEMVNVVLADSALTTLNIMNINLALLANHLSKKLEENTTLSSLMLWDRSFCIEGVEKLLVSLENNQTLQAITLMPWYKEHIDVNSFPLATQERIKWFFYPEKK